MPRNRVLSFMSQWGGGPRSPTTEDVKEAPPRQKSTPPPRDPSQSEKLRKLNTDIDTPQSIRGYRADALGQASPHSPSTQSRARAESRANTRPNSMIQTYNPPQMELATDTPPELAPIFSYLNSHSNKSYQEGYFLKLHDLDSSGRPSRDRTWTECFAQLVGTVLSLWDAAALDAAGEDGEVVPTFINLSDASIKMIESLPMNGAAGGSLQNVLSVSTAANNRYLLHFNSLNSLTQWTAGIRLAMFEHSTLQEAYTGSLIAGKGRYLNGIKQIMERTRFAYDDWARVRFGAGTPWRRCWCVISPPDEKEWQKSQKSLKKGSAYTRPQLPKGDIKFYDTRKVTKKTKPIATISDAYAAYAIYPQSKPLVEQSTLVKLEGLVTIHGGQETTTEGFVFVMPEVHAAVSGFEMMLRWLFPVYDTFGLYGRPTRLIADTLDARGLMFAMPKDRRYGYLDILDVSGLIHEKGSQNWSERQWRKELRKLTSVRMTTALENGDRGVGSRRNTMSRNSLPPSNNGVQLQHAAIHSTPGSRSASPHKVAPGNVRPPSRTDSAPPTAFSNSPHKRSVSDAPGYRRHMAETPSRLSYEQNMRDDDQPPAPPRHGGVLGSNGTQSPSPIERVHSDDRLSTNSPYEEVAAAASPYLPPPEPVVSPPEMQHNPHSRPAAQPHVTPELRRAHSNVDEDTLQQMQDAVRNVQQEGYAMPQSNEQTLAYREQQYLPVERLHGYSGHGAYRGEETRLESIPGSPYHAVSGEYFDANERPNIDELAARSEQRPELAHNRSSQSISRKPLPNRQLPQVPQDGQSSARSGQQVRDDVETPASPPSPAGSFIVDPTFVDEDLIARVLNDDSERTNTIASTETPDYASSGRSSLEEQKRKEQQEKKAFERRGKLKTVGDPTMSSVPERAYGSGKLDTWDKDKEEQSSEIPTIEFGPTYTYKVHSRPSTSGTMTPGEMGKHQRSKSRDRLRESSGSRMSSYFDAPEGSPAEKRRSSYFAGARTPTPTGIEAQETVEPSNKRSSMAWAPGVASAGSPSSGLTPEQFVQLKFEQSQRPQYAPQPQYAQRTKSLVPPIAHSRNFSTNDLPQMRRSMAKTPPPFQRSISGDWTMQRAESPQTPPSRPHSRNLLRRSSGATLLNSTQAVTLSAKERTQVSRMTGAPLVSMAANEDKRKKFDMPNAGLIGALADRERDRANVDRYRSGAVQGAVAMTIQQQAEAQQAALLAQQERQHAAQMAAQKAAQTAQFNQMAHERAQRMLAPQQRSSMYLPQQTGQVQQTAPQMQHRQSWAPDMLQQQLLQQQMQIQQMQQMQQQQGYGMGQQSQASVYGGQYVQQPSFGQQQPMYGQQQQQQQQYYQPRR